MAEIFPNLIIAGAPKSGSTSLFDWLSVHPQICASLKKELVYFMDDGFLLDSATPSYRESGLPGYSRFFSHCAKRSGTRYVLEASPEYLYQQTALEVIPGLPVPVRLIFILRKPEDRVYSLFSYAKNTLGMIPSGMDFSEFVTDMLSEAAWLQQTAILKNAIAHSRYIDYLEPWIKALPEHSILFYLFENLRADNKLFIHQVCSDLGLDNRFYETYDFSIKNPSVVIRSQKVRKTARAVAICIKRYIGVPPPRLKKFYQIVYQSINTTKAPARSTEDKQTILRLHELFEESNRRLSDLTGLNLDSWSA